MECPAPSPFYQEYLQGEPARYRQGGLGIQKAGGLEQMETVWGQPVTETKVKTVLTTPAPMVA